MRAMRFWLSAILLTAVLAVGVFGFAGMSHDMSHGSGNCIASSANNYAVCPQDFVSSALYHINAYKSFTEAVAATPLISLILALLALLLYLAIQRVFRGLAPVSVAVSSHAIPHRSVPYTKIEFIRWLSRFENSPTVPCGA
ncbi:hypothetical protein C4585_03655 [Candidatus Parcubacteria bacterium]|nr:MAG: hypothetical protein C4585_03655 [Candidatus Parcubacteria bacterium]